MHTLLIYFSLAALPSLLTAKAPGTGWDWWLWGGTALYQGILAVKAYQSNSKGVGKEVPMDPTPTPTEVVVETVGGASTTPITPPPADPKP